MAIALAAALFVGFSRIGHLRQRARAKATTERIRVLSTILLAERPRDVTPEVLAELCAKHRRSDTLHDAWGRPLLVTMEGQRYVVTSLGRDGRQSGCCVAADQASPDTDLIAADGEWRQVWN